MDPTNKDDGVNPHWQDLSSQKNSKNIISTALMVLMGIPLIIGTVHAIFKTPVHKNFTQSPNGMGPLFNGLNDEDKSAVIFAIITMNPAPKGTATYLNKQLPLIAEQFAQPDSLPIVRHALAEADINPKHSQHAYVAYARSMAQGYAPQLPETSAGMQAG